MPPHPFLQPPISLLYFILKLSITTLKKTLPLSPPFHQIEFVLEFLLWILAVLVVWFLLLGFLIICRDMEGKFEAVIAMYVSKEATDIGI
jgi:hypothetical protein